MSFLSKCIALGILVLSVGCTHMDDIVKEVRFNKEGDLVVIKCDEKLYWNVYFTAWGEGDCREEIKPKPIKN